MINQVSGRENKNLANISTNRFPNNWIQLLSGMVLVFHDYWKINQWKTSSSYRYLPMTGKWPHSTLPMMITPNKNKEKNSKSLKVIIKNNYAISFLLNSMILPHQGPGQRVPPLQISTYLPHTVVVKNMVSVLSTTFTCNNQRHWGVQLQATFPFCPSPHCRRGMVSINKSRAPGSTLVR